MRTVLVIDIGTSSVRTVLAGEDLKILAMIQRKRSVGSHINAEEEWDCIRTMIRRLVEENGALLRENPVSAAAVSALVGWVGVDRKGNAITPCYTYMHREQKIFDEMKTRLEGNETIRICGRAPAPEWMAYKLRRIKKEEPDLYEEIAVMTSLKDFINIKLCGVPALDHTTAGYTFLYDIGKGDWCKPLLDHFEVGLEKLPQLIRPWEKLGTVRPKLAKEFLLNGEIPVAAGSCDGSTAILGAGGVNEKTAVSVMGTTDVLFLVAKDWKAKENSGLIINPHVIPGYWLIGGPMGMYGGTVEWFRKSIMGESKSLDELNRLAAELEPGCFGLTVLPNLAGERTPYWNASCVGTLAGLTAEHRAEHIFRGILEANGYDCREILERAGRMGAECSGIIAIGGEASNNLWLSIKAAVTGLPVWRNEVTEATVAGSAMLALLMQDGMGVVGTTVRTDVFESTRRQKEQYDCLYRIYKERRKIAESLYK